MTVAYGYTEILTRNPNNDTLVMVTSSPELQLLSICGALVS